VKFCLLITISLVITGKCCPTQKITHNPFSKAAESQKVQSTGNEQPGKTDVQYTKNIYENKAWRGFERIVGHHLVGWCDQISIKLDIN